MYCICIAPPYNCSGRLNIPGILPAHAVVLVKAPRLQLHPCWARRHRRVLACAWGCDRLGCGPASLGYWWCCRLHTAACDAATCLRLVARACLHVRAAPPAARYSSATQKVYRWPTAGSSVQGLCSDASRAHPSIHRDQHVFNERAALAQDTVGALGARNEDKAQAQPSAAELLKPAPESPCICMRKMWTRRCLRTCNA